MASVNLNQVDLSVLKTLLYSDIFDFPLTRGELWHYLISKKRISKKSFEHSLNRLKKIIKQKNGYFYFKEREDIVLRRLKSSVIFEKKMNIAKNAASYLSKIPGIKLIGISGSLAVGDGDKNDDIDFFIITKRGELLVTRFAILVTLQLLGLRRKRQDKNPADKICVNLLIDEARLSWDKKKQDFYVAREIAQLKPIFDRDNTYKNFLSANQWAAEFLPNIQGINFQNGFLPERNFYPLKIIGFLLKFSPFAFFVKLVQLFLIKIHRTNELIGKEILAFHPLDYRSITLSKMRLKTQKIGLLTKV